MNKNNQNDFKNIFTKEYLEYESTTEEIDSVGDELKVDKIRPILFNINNYKGKVSKLVSNYEEDNDYFSCNNKFLNLDFSKCDEDFKEKNIRFFEKLNSGNFLIDLILNNGSLDFYSLIKVNANDEEYELDNFYGKEKLVGDNVIPIPVFFDITGNHNRSYDQNDYKKYFKEEFGLKVENIYERENEEYYCDNEVPIEELKIKLAYGEELSDEDINRIIYSKRRDQDIFEYGIPMEKLIEYIFSDTYNNSGILDLDKSEEFLGEEIKEYFKKASIRDLREYFDYGNLSKLYQGYALDELRYRYIEGKKEYLLSSMSKLDDTDIKNKKLKEEYREILKLNIKDITYEDINLYPHFIKEVGEYKDLIRLEDEEKAKRELHTFNYSLDKKYDDELELEGEMREEFKIMKEKTKQYIELNKVKEYFPSFKLLKYKDFNNLKYGDKIVIGKGVYLEGDSISNILYYIVGNQKQKFQVQHWNQKQTVLERVIPFLEKDKKDYESDFYKEFSNLSKSFDKDMVQYNYHFYVNGKGGYILNNHLITVRKKGDKYIVKNDYGDFEFNTLEEAMNF